MDRIGSWWTKRVDAEEGEVVVWSKSGQRRQSSQRSVGGKLYLTDRRVLFCPHLFDGALGGRTWELSLARVVGVGIEPKNRAERQAGGLRRRLRIESNAGAKDLFVVNGLEAVVERLDAAAREARPAAGPSSVPGDA